MDFIKERNIKIPHLKDGEKNYSAIPEAIIEKNVNMLLMAPNGAELSRKILHDLEDQFLQYETHKTRLAAKKRMIKERLPELKKTHHLIEMLRHQTKPIETRFQLSHELHKIAIVPPTKMVYLWLGANVMLEYTPADAAEKIRDKIHKFYVDLKCIEFDEFFVCDQMAKLEDSVNEVTKLYKVLTFSQRSVQPPTEGFANLHISESKHK